MKNSVDCFQEEGFYAKSKRKQDGFQECESESGRGCPESRMGVIKWMVFRRSLFNFPHPSVGRFSWRNLSRAEGENNLVAVLRPSWTQMKIETKPMFYLPLSSENPVLGLGRFWQTVGQYAGCLREVGLCRGDRVAAQVSKTPANVALYLATLQLGGIFLPLNADYTLEEIRYFLGNSEPSVFVCKEQSVKGYGAKKSGLVKGRKDLRIFGESQLEKLATTCDPFINICSVEEDEIAAICYTSGTTGKPKGAMITHRNLKSNAQALCEAWRIEKEDILLHALPVNHAHGLFICLNSLMMAGGSVVFLPRFDVEVVMEWLPKVTVMMGVPTFYTRLLQRPEFGPELVKNIRLFVSGSAPLLESTWEEFRQRSGGHRILERYGMTEGQVICSNPYEEDMRKPGKVGAPLPGTEVRVRNGVLEMKGRNVFKGYWRMPERTEMEFTEDGYFISGDLALIDSNGHVQILGRGKDLIISGGLNVYPKEIENVLDEHVGIEESAVIGVPHEDFGEAVLAVVVLKRNAQITESDVSCYARERLAGYKMPKRIFLVEDLPRNVMGKVQKNVLREQYKGCFSKKYK